MGKTSDPTKDPEFQKGGADVPAHETEAAQA
jgi:hypothetical protein